MVHYFLRCSSCVIKVPRIQPVVPVNSQKVSQYRRQAQRSLVGTWDREIPRRRSGYLDIPIGSRSAVLWFLATDASPVSEISSAPPLTKISFARPRSLLSSVWTDIKMFPSLAL